MSIVTTAKPVKRQDDVRCSCGKLREECVRLMVREIWRTNGQTDGQTGGRPYWHRAA